MSTDRYTVYVDESGDLGVGKGTRWFVITAVIVKKDDEKTIRNVISSVRNKLNLRTIHFKQIREFNKKLFIVRKFEKLPFTIINVIADTAALELKDSEKTYNFLSKILLERVSWHLRDIDAYADVIFSSRNTRRDNELSTYLTDKVLNYEWNSVEKDRITSVKCEKMESLDLLQMADVCAASMFRSHEPDSYGIIYPCYMNNLRDHLYDHRGRIYSYGIKYYRDSMQPEQEYFNNLAPCNMSKK